MLGKKHVRDIKPPGRENSVRPTFPLGDVTISVCKDSFPLEFLHCCIGQWGEVSSSLDFFSLLVQPNHHSQEGLPKSCTYNTKGIMLSVASPLITKDNTAIIWCPLVQVAWKGHSQVSFCGYFLWQSTALLSCCPDINRGTRESPRLLFSGMLVTLTSGTISPLNSSWWGSSCSSWTTFVLSTGSACSWGKQKLPHLTTIPSLPIYPWAKHMGVHLVTVHRDFPAGGILCEEDQTSC